MDDIQEILNERQKTHGDFSHHADYTQRMKMMIIESEQHNTMKGSEDNNMTVPQREALEMIMHKIGRILAGNPNHQDHWDDIAGYARLAAKEYSL